MKVRKKSLDMNKRKSADITTVWKRKDENLANAKKNPDINARKGNLRTRESLEMNH